jgi:hypothetical protein
MADLITLQELATWARREIEPDDTFAATVISAASLVVSETAQHPEWTRSGATAAPPRAKLICAMLAKRTYLNPDAVVREGSIGPIGGDSYIEDFARTLELTAAETATLQGFIGDGTGAAYGGLWIQPTTRGDLEMQGVFIPDSGGSDWMIPYGDASEDFWFSPPVYP